MAHSSHSPPGILHAFRGLLETFVAILQSRLELVSVECREEIIRASGLLVLGAVAAFGAAMVGFTFTALIVVVFWAYAPWVLGGFVVFYAGMAFVAWRVLLKGLEKPFFVDTLAQLKKDREWLTPRS